MLGIAMPHFWLGMLLILLFSVTLSWLPASGYVPFLQAPGQNIKYMLIRSNIYFITVYFHKSSFSISS